MLNERAFLLHLMDIRTANVRSVSIPPSSETNSTIVSFGNLESAWDYGTGEPIAPNIIQTALWWNSFLELGGFSYTDAFPGSGGEIVLGAGKDDHYIEVIIESDGKTISVAYDFKRKQVCYNLRKSPEEAIKIVSEIMRQVLWNASTLSTQENTMKGKVSGPGQPSGTIRGRYQSYPVNAFRIQGIRSANTSVNIMEILPASPVVRLSSGGSKQITYHQEVA